MEAQGVTLPLKGQTVTTMENRRENGTHSEVFYKNVLDHMTVYADCRVEVHLNLLPMKWVFALEQK